jgi:glycosyltransferase involved in cell wall biosynthesis
MTRPLITCIVPVYNGERYLGEALDSILAQTRPPEQIIVADDGSTDGTAGVVASYGDRILYLYQPNARPSAARNLGLRAAEGEFVTFLDSDDRWHPEKLARQLARFEANPAIEYCVTHVQNFWVPELQEEADRFRGHPRSAPTPGYVTQTLMARRSLFERIGPFNTELKNADAADWFLRADSAGAQSELLPDVLVHRRLHANNRSRMLSTNSRDEYLRLLKDSMERRRSIESGPASRQ